MLDAPQTIGQYSPKKDPLEQLVLGWKKKGKPFKTKEFENILLSLSHRKQPQEIIDQLAKMRQSVSEEQMPQFLQQTRFIINTLKKQQSHKIHEWDLKELVAPNETDSVATRTLLDNMKEVGQNIAPPSEFAEVKKRRSIKSLSLRKVKLDIKKSNEDVKASNQNEQKIEIPTNMRAYFKSDMTDMDAVAKQMAADIKSHSLMLAAKIEPNEFLEQNWTKNKGPNIQKMIAYSNNFPAMIRQDIVLATSEAEQKKVIKFYGKLLDECVKQGDFNAAVNIVASFNDSSLSRLKHLQGDIAEALEKNGRIASMGGNFKIARQEMGKYEGGDAIPPLMVLLHDYTFVDDGNKDKIEVKDGKEKIEITNLAKLEMEGKMLTSFVNIQKKAREQKQQVSGSSLIEHLTSQHISESLAYDLSLSNLARGEGQQPKYDIEKINHIAEITPAVAKANHNLSAYMEKLVHDSKGLGNIKDFDVAKKKGKNAEWTQSFNSQGQLVFSFKGVDVSAIQNIPPGEFVQALARELNEAGYKITISSESSDKIVLEGDNLIKFAQQAGLNLKEMEALHEVSKAPSDNFKEAWNNANEIKVEQQTQKEEKEESTSTKAVELPNQEKNEKTSLPSSSRSVSEPQQKPVQPIPAALSRPNSMPESIKIGSRSRSLPPQKPPRPVMGLQSLINKFSEIEATAQNNPRLKEQAGAVIEFLQKIKAKEGDNKSKEAQIVDMLKMVSNQSVFDPTITDAAKKGIQDMSASAENRRSNGMLTSYRGNGAQQSGFLQELRDKQSARLSTETEKKSIVTPNKSH
ncbi:MAG: hypothetical protein BGO43_07245 [Gammaproteobacteria bacterium 39-13]|nr:hypothetical protein [Gammaproteobacteria bacterium]OJV88382.1 MAG: hypothetical protein BGO43_07245 [Gammaproteobacteria bacterium 39-13]